MCELNTFLKYFIQRKIHEDPKWQKIKVIFSGGDVPGEGEHKIMDYIRSAKSQPDYEPNLAHCIHGLDADLIMLSLLSHEPKFVLLREKMVYGPVKPTTANKKPTDYQVRKNSFLFSFFFIFYFFLFFNLLFLILIFFFLKKKKVFSFINSSRLFGFGIWSL